MLHLQHQIELGKARISALYPIEPFQRTQLLGTQVLKKLLEMVVHYLQVIAGECADRSGAGAIDCSKKKSLNFVAQYAPKSCRIEVPLSKACLWRSSSKLSSNNYATIGKHGLRWMKIQIL